VSVSYVLYISGVDVSVSVSVSESVVHRLSILPFHLLWLDLVIDISFCFFVIL